MCGRYTLRAEPRAIAAQFKLIEAPLWSPRYNIAPTQPVLGVVRRADGQREGRLFRWGLIPSWAKDASIGNRMINARSETVDSKPAYRGSFRHHRCLIPADGFYEWQAQGRVKQPQLMQMQGSALFAFAGLWDHWQDPDGSEIESCTIITTRANALMAPIHDRMPVILREQDITAWLDPDAKADALKAIMAGAAADHLHITPVSRHVNAPAHDDPRCVEPAEAGLF